VLCLLTGSTPISDEAQAPGGPSSAVAPPTLTQTIVYPLTTPGPVGTADTEVVIAWVSSHPPVFLNSVIRCWDGDNYVVRVRFIEMDYPGQVSGTFTWKTNTSAIYTSDLDALYPDGSGASANTLYF
jgi:hypothetical protein